VANISTILNFFFLLYILSYIFYNFDILNIGQRVLTIACQQASYSPKQTKYGVIDPER
jgi:hypothetical protein